MINDLGVNPDQAPEHFTHSYLFFGCLRHCFCNGVSQIHQQTSVKTLCNDLQVVLRKMRKKDANQKKERKLCNCICVIYSEGKWQGETQANLQRLHVQGDQCLYQHPNTVGRCLRCGSTEHVVADCKRLRRDPSANNKGKGCSTSSAPSKAPRLNRKQRPRPRVIPRRKLPQIHRAKARLSRKQRFQPAQYHHLLHKLTLRVQLSDGPWFDSGRPNLAWCASMLP